MIRVAHPARFLLPACAAAAVLGGCWSPSPSPVDAIPSPPAVHVTGSASYLEKILLPAETELVVTVRDLTRSGVVDWIVGAQQETVGHRNPLAFDVGVTALQCIPGNKYSVTVSVVVGPRVWAEATADVPGLGTGAPAPLSLTLRRVADPGDAR